MKDRIDFAIEQLEKVKEWVNKPFDQDGCFKTADDLYDFIDQQIGELKEREI